MVQNMELEKMKNNVAPTSPHPHTVSAQLQCSKRYLLSMLEDVPENTFGVPSYNGFYAETCHVTHISSDPAPPQLSVKSPDTPVAKDSDPPNNVKDHLSGVNGSSTSDDMKGVDLNGGVTSEKDQDSSFTPPNESYLLQRGRKMGRRCNCRLSERSLKFHCNEFSEMDRQLLFNFFWKHMNWQQRKGLISSLVRCTIPSARRKDCKDPHRKEYAFQYHLKKNDRVLRVCKVMFINTFSIGEFCVRDWALNNKMEADS